MENHEEEFLDLKNPPTSPSKVPFNKLRAEEVAVVYEESQRALLHSNASEEKLTNLLRNADRVFKGKQ
jgi:hypothetical protein